MKLTPHWQRLSLLGASLTATLALLSCGSSDADPMATFRNQTLDWRDCDPTIVPAPFDATLKRMGSRASCFNMRVPLDYANPERGEAVVALLRVKAEDPDPSQRLGAILFNPGGPGGDGLYLGLSFGELWSQANQDDPTGKLYKQLSQRYDLIGFSPRGVGASTRLYCGSNEQYRSANLPSDRSSANLQAINDNARLQAQACSKNPLTPFINSDATARDMDLARHLLGDEKLNYYGISYGTWLGDWYARLFPQRVGRMVYSGVVDFTAPFYSTFLQMGMGRERVLTEVLAPYAARYPERFGFKLGISAQDLRHMYLSFLPELREAASFALWTLIGNSIHADTTLRGLRTADLVNRWLSETPVPNEAEVNQKIAENFNSDGARQFALRLSASYFSALRQVTFPVELSLFDAVQWSVSCNDIATPYDVATWNRLNDLDAVQHPFFGAKFSGLPCLFWDQPPVNRPPAAAAADAGVVMLQAQFDGLTPTEGTMKSFALLPKASLILVDQEYTHGIAVPYGTPCVDQPIAEYLLTGQQPARKSLCAGLPLPADREKASGGAQPRSATAAIRKPSSVFNDPAAAAQLIEQIGRIVSGHRLNPGASSAPGA